MVTTATPVPLDWRQEWFAIEDATFLNAAGNAPMPKVSIRAVVSSLELKKFPHRIADSAYFETPMRIREAIAKLIGAQGNEIALTTGASSGTTIVAYNIDWKPGDEILTGKGEFPLQFTTWKPMEEREGIKLQVVSPRERFISADDFIAALTPKTRLVSTSLVRFDDGVLLDAGKLAAACQANGTLLLLDASQCCGAIPMDVAKLGADFIVCAGYKWLLSPYGTGFLWAKNEAVAKMRSGPFYWMALEGADRFASLVFTDPKPAAGARRWDSAETASYFNLAGMDASLQFVLNLQPETVSAHNNKLIDLLFARLPKDRCVPASPLDPARRGPYACFVARTPEKTAALYESLQKENVIVSLREGNIRVSPHVYNTERDIDQLIKIITA